MNYWCRAVSFICKIFIVLFSFGSVIAGIVLGFAEESFGLFLLISVSGIAISFINFALIMAFAEMCENVAEIRNKIKGFGDNNPSTSINPLQRDIITYNTDNSSEDIIDVKVINIFRDSKTGIIHNVGETLKISKERYDEITKAGPYIEKIK